MKVDFLHKFVSITEEERIEYINQFGKSAGHKVGILALEQYLKTISIDKNTKAIIPKHVLIVTSKNNSPSTTIFTFSRNTVEKYIKEHHTVLFFIEFIPDYIQLQLELDGIKEPSEKIRKTYANIHTHWKHSNIRLRILGGITRKEYINITNNQLNEFSIHYYKLDFSLIQSQELNEKLDIKDPGIRFFRRYMQFEYAIGTEDSFIKSRQNLLETVYLNEKNKIVYDPDDLITEKFNIQGHNPYKRELVETISFFLHKYFTFCYDNNKITAKWFVDTECMLFEKRIDQLYKKNNYREKDIVTSLCFTDLFKKGELEFGLISKVEETLKEPLSEIETAEISGSKIKCRYYFVCRVSQILGLNGFNIKKTHIIDGNCYFNYINLYNFMKAFYRKSVSSDILEEAELERILATRKATRLRPVLLARQAIENSRKSALHFASGGTLELKKDDDNGRKYQIPDIEDCYKRKLYPLCTNIIIRRLLTESPYHLKHFERFFLIRFLYELGYGYLDIKSFLSRHDTKFKYESELIPFVAKNGESRFIPHNQNFTNTKVSTYPCSFYASDEYKQDGFKMERTSNKKKKYKVSKKTEANHFTGCPFFYLKDNLELLKKELVQYGIVDRKLGENNIGEILDAVKNNEYRTACVITFEKKYQTKVTASMAGRSLLHDKPSTYFTRALSLEREREEEQKRKQFEEKFQKNGINTVFDNLNRKKKDPNAN